MSALQSLAIATVMTAILFPSHDARAWGAEGHAIVADIAERHLTPQALRRVTEILHGQRMWDVANYADQIRPARRETSCWHYVNFAPGAEDYRAERDCKQIEGQGDCFIAAISRSMDVLKSSGEQQELALKFLIHFVADVHQPFHAVAEAVGGNQIAVTFQGKAICTSCGIRI